MMYASTTEARLIRGLSQAEEGQGARRGILLPWLYRLFAHYRRTRNRCGQESVSERVIVALRVAISSAEEEFGTDHPLVIKAKSRLADWWIRILYSERLTNALLPTRLSIERNCRAWFLQERCDRTRKTEHAVDLSDKSTVDVGTTREADQPSLPHGQDLARALRDLGWALFHAGHASKALFLLDRSWQLVPLTQRSSWEVDRERRTVAERFWHDKGDYLIAEALYADNLSDLEANAGEAAPEVIDGLYDLAWLYCRSGRYVPAAGLYARALAVAFSSKDDNTTADLRSLAHVKRKAGEHDAALKLFERVERLEAADEAALVKPTYRKVQNLDFLCIAWESVGQSKKAEVCFRRANQVHPEIAGGWWEYRAVTYCEEGLWSYALKLYRLYGHNRDRLRDPQARYKRALQLAGWLQGLQRFGLARRLFEYSVVQAEREDGPSSSVVAFRLHDLALCCRAAGEHSAAISFGQQSLAIIEGNFGPESLRAADGLDVLADLYQSAENFSEAASLLRRSLAIREITHKSEPSADVATSLARLARVLLELHDTPGAISFYQRALALSEKLNGTVHPRYARILEGLAIAYSVAHRQDFARALMRRVLAIRRQTLGPNHELTRLSEQCVETQ